MQANLFMSEKHEKKKKHFKSWRHYKGLPMIPFNQFLS